ncbi:MAG: hypothetical protein KDA87_16895 [Planctomycetales bacterium]|nr:hypothetical protein [Planctomycetales bacterium]
MARSDAEHVQQILDEGKFQRRPVGTNDLRANCSTGYIFTTSSASTGETISENRSNFHHILPIETISDGAIVPADKLDFFHNCMAITEWDINDADNLIGLPTRSVFEAAERTGAAKSDEHASSWMSGLRNVSAQLGMRGTLPDLPCHEIEHNPDYNDGVISYLEKQVWQPLAKQQSDCNIDPKSIRSQLCKASKHWRSFLENRGKEHGGASRCWHKRNETGFKHIWYIPFSMNPGTPRPVPPPPPLENRPSTIKNWMKSMIPSR